jgi:FkbM family methyltransferase
MTVQAFVLSNSDHGPLIINRLDFNDGFGGGVYGVGCQIMERGGYEPREINTIKELLNLRREFAGDGMMMIDCGANIGIHTVECARLMRDWGSVIAIEAQERIFYALAGNLALHNSFNARAVWAAVSDEVGTICIPEMDYTRNASFGSFELKQRIGTEFIGQEIDYDKPTLDVRKITLDSLDLPRVDLIKIDVEGMELEALGGAVSTIERCKPILVVECVKVDKMQLNRLLVEMGYGLFPMGMNTLAVHKEDRVTSHLSVEKEQAA